MSLPRIIFHPARSGLAKQSSSIGTRCRYTQIRLQHVDASSSGSHLPRILQPSLWESVFPKSLRQQAKESVRTISKGPTNPQTYFIWIYIVIGSQAIKILSIQNEFNAFMRKADLKIGKLREVVEKLQNGEPVDVEKVLGTGNEEQEQEWEDALREIEREEHVWQEGKRKRQEEQDRLEAQKEDASPVYQATATPESSPDLPATIIGSAPSRPGFY